MGSMVYYVEFAQLLHGHGLMEYCHATLKVNGCLTMYPPPHPTNVADVHVCIVSTPPRLRSSPYHDIPSALIEHALVFGCFARVWCMRFEWPHRRYGVATDAVGFALT
jgi:hypothetical protein